MLNEIELSGMVDVRHLWRFKRLVKNKKLFSSKHWFSHETDLIRYFVLHKYGGWYLDTDVILLREVRGIRNIIGLEDDHNINGAVIHTECENCFATLALREFFKVYDPKKPWNHVGPGLLTSLVNDLRDHHDICDVYVAPQHYFETVHYSMNE